jgi:cytidyltransferase-like protein
MLTNKHYKYGAFLGKFYPLHRGHQFAIDTMISMCDNSMVLCYPSPHEKISPQAREDALKYLYKDKCKIKVISDDGILNDVFESNYYLLLHQ